MTYEFAPTKEIASLTLQVSRNSPYSLVKQHKSVDCASIQSISRASKLSSEMSQIIQLLH